MLDMKGCKHCRSPLLGTLHAQGHMLGASLTLTNKLQVRCAELQRQWPSNLGTQGP